MSMIQKLTEATESANQTSSSALSIAGMGGALSIAGRGAHADEELNIRFVNMVREHKCIYDKYIPEYRNKEYPEQAWILIAKELNDSVLRCKERWRNLRACMSRYIKQQHSSEPQHKPYYLATHMNFLLPYLRTSVTTTPPTTMSGSEPNLNALHQYVHKFEMKSSPATQPDEDDDEETIDAYDADETADRLTNDEHNNGNYSSPSIMQKFVPDVQLSEHPSPNAVYMPPAQETQASDGYQPHFQPAKRFRSDCDASPTAKASPTSPQNSCYSLCMTERADMEFFRSLLPDLAGFTPHQKRKFKIGILQLIDSIAELSPATPAPAAQCTALNPISSSSSSNGGGHQPRLMRSSTQKAWRN